MPVLTYVEIEGTEFSASDQTFWGHYAARHLKCPRRVPNYPQFFETVEKLYLMYDVPDQVGWLVVQVLTSHRTHYRSYQRRVFCKGFPSLLQVKRPNQQHQ